MELQLELTASV